MYLKGGLSLEIKKIHIHLYFIASEYSINDALVEYKVKWTGPYTDIV